MPTMNLHRSRMMVLKTLILGALLACMTSAFAESASFGFVEFQGDKIYLHTPSSRASIRSAALQYADEKNKSACCIRVSSKDVLQDGESSTNDTPTSYFRHEIRPRPPFPKFNFPFIGMALINVHGHIQSSAASMTAKAGDGSIVLIEKCLEREGVNLMTTASFPVKNLYYYLGYEIDLNDVAGEPICEGVVTPSPKPSSSIVGN
ncbi:MAG: hypothetical protein V4636_01830 [Pseudomonadota bacterium]